MKRSTGVSHRIVSTLNVKIISLHLLYFQLIGVILIPLSFKSLSQSSKINFQRASDVRNSIKVIAEFDFSVGVYIA